MASRARRSAAWSIGVMVTVMLMPALASAAACAAPPIPEPGFGVLWDGVSEPTERGWTQSGPGSFEVVNDGAQGCRLESRGGLGLLWFSDRAFSDFELRLQWRSDDDTDNSGVFVRFPAGGADTHNVAINQGYEVQIREGGVDNENQKTGSIYNQQPALLRNAKPAGGWNDYSIVVTSPLGQGQPPLITATLNGQVVNVFQARVPGRAASPGHVGLQNHGDADAISFRNIRIKGLLDDAPPSTRVVVRGAERSPNGSYDGAVRVSFEATDDLGGTGVGVIEYRIDGGAWKTFARPVQVLLDRTEESFARWKQAPTGSFARLPDGSIHSIGGLGLLWYPEQAFGDVAFQLQWRDARPEVTGDSNSGVFVRFPNPDETVARAVEERLPCQVGSGTTQPAWAAVMCGQEIQVNDAADGDPQKTGSVYNFKPLTLDLARPNVQGQWNDYEIRTIGGGDYLVEVIRNGEIINRWRNAPGQKAARAGDPPTDLRQFARGYIGLQNHGFGDHVQFRDVRVVDLSTPTPVTIAAAGAHTLEFRSTDAAGNMERTKTLHLTIACTKVAGIVRRDLPSTGARGFALALVILIVAAVGARALARAR